MRQFNCIPSEKSLEIRKTTKDVVYYNPFTVNSLESIDLIDEYEFDIPYYKYLEAALKHLLYKADIGWIPSERQIYYSSPDCISGVHFLYDEESILSNVHVFCRSTNMNQIAHDLQFFKKFLSEYEDNSKVSFEMIFSCPHRFL